MQEIARRRLERFAWAVLGYTVLVILFGAWVRITGSGAGCGEHWPSCHGELVPRSPTAATIIEFTHRVTSGLCLLSVLALLWLARRVFPRGHAVRLGAALAVLFTITEALVGAGLVRFGLVDKNDSVARAVVMAIHLVNTSLLTAALGKLAPFPAKHEGLALDELREGVAAIRDQAERWAEGEAAPTLSLSLR